MKDLIKRLVETNSPSGYESAIREVIMAEIEPLVAEMRIDPLGNLIARKGSLQAGGRRIMIAGHMDEIGVIVTHVDEKGFVRFAGIGGLYPQALTGSRVQFMNGTMGVVFMEARHLENNTPAGLDKFFIDVGACSRADCPVRPGDVAVFWRPFVDMGSRLMSKAMDDRIAVAIMIETLRNVKDTPNELNFVFTTQEEVGLRGAQVSSFSVNPDLGLAVDITDSYDTPNNYENSLAMGKGPAIKVMDDYLIADGRIVHWMTAAAEKLEIPYQYEVLTEGGTDAGAIQDARAGVPAGCLSISTRYAHSPSEMVDYQDVLHAVKLLTELVSNPVDLDLPD